LYLANLKYTIIDVTEDSIVAARKGGKRSMAMWGGNNQITD